MPVERSVIYHELVISKSSVTGIGVRSLVTGCSTTTKPVAATLGSHLGAKPEWPLGIANPLGELEDGAFEFLRQPGPRASVVAHA